jgi:hypothetical protein
MFRGSEYPLAVQVSGVQALSGIGVNGSGGGGRPARTAWPTPAVPPAAVPVRWLAPADNVYTHSVVPGHSDAYHVGPSLPARRTDEPGSVRGVLALASLRDRWVRVNLQAGSAHG